jgi:hypothetical protein
VCFAVIALLLGSLFAEYNVRLQFPDMPLVDVGGAKSNYLPAEMCEILPNQPFRGKLTDEVRVLVRAYAE